jgi:hypothetical protein
MIERTVPSFGRLDAAFNNAGIMQRRVETANLSEADLMEAKLIGSDLSGADLSGINLVGADLMDVNLRDANLAGAFMGKTILAHIDLRGAKGLASINHWHPSTIESHSVQLSQDGSVLHFLRGTGVPDTLVDFYFAKMRHSIQYFSVFISYSSKDEIVAKRLHEDLQANGVRCWFAPEDLKIGDKIRTRIDEAIHLQDKLLLLLSEHSLAPRSKMRWKPHWRKSNGISVRCSFLCGSTRV